MTTTADRYATPTASTQTVTPDLMEVFRASWAQVAVSFSYLEPPVDDERSGQLRRELIERVRSGGSGLDVDALARVDHDLWGMPEPT